ncbi:MAG: DUF4365 domain-containing protein [Terriglobia bacterium]
MANAQGIPDLGPLPESDENAELQRSSLKALNSLLQNQDDIVFRDERIEDYGVDGAFELKIGGRMTNFRGQVQLKGTSSAEANQDGSISLPVRTANLNYLLNGTLPIYLLFDDKKKQFWYAWAHDECRRLEASKPAWREQATVSLRFTERFTASAIPGIVDRVLREGRMHRRIHDSLMRSTTSEPVVVSIDAASLEVTDPLQAQHILLASGPALVAAGFPKEALRMLGVVDSRTRDLARLQLTAAYAEYTLGKYHNALGHIGQAMACTQELSERDRAFLGKLKDTSEFHVGIIDVATYERRMEKWAEALHGLGSLDARLQAIYYRFLRERDQELRAMLTEEARKTTSEILEHPDATKAIKLGARLMLIYIEGTAATAAETHQLGLYWMRASMFAAHTKGMVQEYRKASSRLADWETSANAALKDAHELGHPILIAEALMVVLSFRIVQLMNERLSALYLGRAFEVSNPAASAVRQGITSALAIHELNGSVEGRLRLNILHADFLEIIGDLACAKELAARICPEAEAMGFADIAERARELLDDRTILMEFERDWSRFKQADEDISFGNLSDQEMRGFARDGLESLGLPPHCLEVFEQYCKSLREVARERSRWCRHIEMLEDIRQTRNPATAFSVLPNRKCVCEKLGYETENVTSDAQALIRAFKHVYCVNCKDRNPKQE